ncbi:MAG: DinB family protein [Verrucomicrobiota bacterium]
MDSLVEDNIVCLRQGLLLLEKLDYSSYTAKSEGTLNSSVGAHFRHNIDHYECFLNGVATGQADYDHRERDPVTETHPEAASDRMANIIDRLGALSPSQIVRPLRVKMDSGTASQEPWSQSTVRRELQFLVSHTVHHYALIAVICRAINVIPEEDFGVAPSTLRFQAEEQAHSDSDSVACAQ